MMRHLLADTAAGRSTATGDRAHRKERPRQRNRGGGRKLKGFPQFLTWIGTQAQRHQFVTIKELPWGLLNKRRAAGRV